MTTRLRAACASRWRLLCAAALLLPALGAQPGAALTTLHSFGVGTSGKGPTREGLVQGSDGNFYGTTSSGGRQGVGTVFKISPNGALTTLYSFSGTNDGAYPCGALVQGSDGNFYATTHAESTHQFGTVFKISPDGALTTLHLFTGGNDGGFPQGLVQGSDGNFYGTTEFGGTYYEGTVFEISPYGALTNLYSFTGGNDGICPQGLVQGSDGNFYGTTQLESTHQFGTVFKISPDGALTTLHLFTGGNDGGQPFPGLAQGSDGYFYGTTECGGTMDMGTVFKISTNGALTTLHLFGGGDIDGAYPGAALVQGSDGNFYGAACDTVFKMTPAGELTTLAAGLWYASALVQGSDGDFYATTSGGGTAGDGTVFKISTTGALTTLYSFGANEGAGPNGLVQGSDGSFYGTTESGGTNAHGTVFKISPAGALTSLYSFTGGNDGAYPNGLVQGSDGNFYGATSGGGGSIYGYGTVFKISTTGALTSFYSFLGGTDGWNPNGLVQASDGYFYGTTSGGGKFAFLPGGDGTVFQISPGGALTTLHVFTGGTDGAFPRAGLVQGSDGNLYGTTSGFDLFLPSFTNDTVFKISTHGALTTLYSFAGGKDGGSPVAGLVQGSDGNFYGTTEWGGTYGSGFQGYGTVFKISPNGTLASLHSFAGNDGANPFAALLQGSDGDFYGTTSAGGANNSGTVFKISPNGALASLYSFTGGSDGSKPLAGLVQGSDGGFYGTTYGGGAGGFGTVFRLTVVPAAPVFQPVSLTNGTLGLTWSTEVGGTYQLQYTSDLSSSNWTNLGSAATATGATLSATDSVTNGPPRFYRVVLAP